MDILDFFAKMPDKGSLSEASRKEVKSRGVERPTNFALKNILISFFLRDIMKTIKKKEKLR